MDLEAVLKLRCRIARLGENDAYHWWDSDAATETGLYVLKRLFPKTATWVGVEMAAAAARVRHEALLPKVRAVHLFDLGPETERALDNLVHEMKLSQADASPFLPSPPNPAPADVGEALEALGIVQPDAALKQPGASERFYCVGDVTQDGLRNPATLAAGLAAAYKFSRPGHLIAPYLRVVTL